MAELHIDSRVIAGVPTVYLQGDFDSYSAPRVRALLDSLTASPKPEIHIHLGGLEYIDSTGLGVLVAGLKQATDHAGSLCLISPTPTMERTLRVTGLNQIFRIIADDPAPI